MQIFIISKMAIKNLEIKLLFKWRINDFYSSCNSDEKIVRSRVLKHMLGTKEEIEQII